MFQADLDYRPALGAVEVEIWYMRCGRRVQIFTERRAHQMVERSRSQPIKPNGTRVPDTSLSGHFVAARSALMFFLLAAGTSGSGDKAQGSLVYAIAASPALESSWPKHS
jgi:hypothetical protein